MVLPAAKWAMEIQAARIARMRQEANSAVAAGRDAAAQMRIGRQHRVQGHLILPNKRFSAVVLVPILAKRKNFRDGYDKTARFSVIMLSLSTTSSYYPSGNSKVGNCQRVTTNYLREETAQKDLALPLEALAYQKPEWKVRKLDENASQPKSPKK